MSCAFGSDMFSVYNKQIDMVRRTRMKRKKRGIFRGAARCALGPVPLSQSFSQTGKSA